MGYYTKYSLEIVGAVTRKVTGKLNGETVTIDVGTSDEELRKEIEEQVGYTFEDSVKWYEHEDDMRAFSKRYPTIVFALEGVGEESGDIWKKFFQDGKMQTAKAKITFDAFDASKLK